MRQFVLPDDWREGEDCIVSGSRARYLRDVLRLMPGDRFPGIDRRGTHCILELIAVDKRGIRLSVYPRAPGGNPAGTPLPEKLEDVRSGKNPATCSLEYPETGNLPPITLIQAVPKGSRMDLIVRQAVEAGISRIIPLTSERSLGISGTHRHERWERIIREAVQQSGAARVPQLEPGIDLKDLDKLFAHEAENALALFLHETPLASSGLHGYLTVLPPSICVCVGPEGGFSPEEIRHLETFGCLPLHLGPEVLRTETAAIFAVAAIRIVMLERNSWIPSS